MTNATSRDWRSAMRPIRLSMTRWLEAAGLVRPHWRALVDSLTAIGPDGLASRWQEGRRLIYDNGISYNVYSDPKSTERPWPLDPIPLLIDPREWETIADAMRPAGDPLQRHHRRPLRTAAPSAPQPAAARVDLPPSRIHPAVSRRRGSGRHLPARLFGGSGALARRAMVGDRRSHRRAVGRRLCARKPDRLLARAAGHLSRLARSSARDFLPDLPRDAAQPGAGASREPPYRAADPRPLQRDLLRARLPRALSRLHAGRRRRPDRARRSRLPQDAGRPAAGGPDRAPPGRRLLRSARIARGLDARRAGAGPGGSRRATSRLPTRSARGWSNPPRRPRSCPGCAATSWAKS